MQVIVSNGGNSVAHVFPRSFVDAVQSDDPKPPELILLLHGINDHGSWYEQLHSLLSNGSERRVASLSGGRIGKLRFLLFLMFNYEGRKTAVIAEKIQIICREYGVKRPSIIAHSYGTHILRRILEQHPEISFDIIVLCGSVVRPSFDWSPYRDRYGAIVNECGLKDRWVETTQSVSRRLGYSGRHGFVQPPVQDRFHADVTHSGFFNGQFDFHNWTELFINKFVIRTGINDQASPLYWRMMFATIPVLLLLPKLLKYAFSPTPKDPSRLGSGTGRKD